MDKPTDDQSPLRGSIPHVSRLPVSRASERVTKPTASRLSSQTARTPTSSLRSNSSTSFKSRGFVIRPLGEASNQVTKPQHGGRLNILPKSEPAKPVGQPTISSATTLETTPPRKCAVDLDLAGQDENDEALDEDSNAKFDQNQKNLLEPDKRRPRPSLADRTIETLAQLPPTPSPRRPRSSFFTTDGPMGPPGRRASEASRPKTRASSNMASSSRATPGKRMAKPPVPSLPVKTPPAAHFSRLPLTSPASSPSKSQTLRSSSGVARPGTVVKRGATTRGTVAARTFRGRPALSTLFKDAPKPRSSDGSDLGVTAVKKWLAVPTTPSQTSMVPSSASSAALSVSSISRSSSVSTDNRNTATDYTTLRLTGNEFTRFPIAILEQRSVNRSLRSLDLSHNPLEPADYLDQAVSLPQLKSLSMVSTGLINLDALCTFLDAPQLFELNVSCNRLIGAVPRLREHFPRLSVVIATDNWFDKIDTKSVVGLNQLDLSSNYIQGDIDDQRKDWVALGCEVRL